MLNGFCKNSISVSTDGSLIGLHEVCDFSPIPQILNNSREVMQQDFVSSLVPETALNMLRIH
jgi:hypothetical protein